jgi:hypothetical protein
MTTFTRAQVDSITAGKTRLTRVWDGRRGTTETVTSMHAKQDDIHGKLFVCGYTTHGDTGHISFSIKEGDALDGRLYEIESDTAAAA